MCRQARRRLPSGLQDAGGQADTQALSIVINLFNAAKYHDHHAPGSNSRSVLQSDVTGKWRNWGTYLECPSRIAPSGSHALSGRNHFRHSNQCRNLQLYSDGQRHIESVRHAGSLDCRERAPGNHDNVATSCQRGPGLRCNLAKLGRCPTRELVGRPAPACRSQPQCVDR